jgi:hypothetical protein
MIFSLSALNVMAQNWNLEKDLPHRLADVNRRLLSAKSPDDYEKLSQEIQDINYWISQSILSAESQDIANPSEQRRAVIAKAAEIIRPYNRLLVETAFSNSRAAERVARQSRSLLDYTAPDDVLRQSLESVARSESLAGLEPYRVLFEHRLLDESLRTVIVAKIEQEQDPKTQQSMALASAEMGFDVAVEACQEILSNPFSAEGMIGSTGVNGDNATLINYGKALKAILYLGPKANALLPLLEQRRDEIVSALGNEAARPYIGGFQAAILCVQGDRPVATVTAVNGSGILSQPQHDPAMPSQSASKPEPLSPAYQANTPKPAVQSATAQSTKQSQQSSSWPWIMGAYLLLAVVGGILLKLRRK